ncbi:MAG: HAMP domain-containing protein [Desulfomonile sp.]|nr:HAMP domain-containing protein [Desulfomonile sp.]
MGRETALNISWSGEKTTAGCHSLPPQEPPPSTEWTVSRKVLLLVTGLLAVLAIAINVICVVSVVEWDINAERRVVAYSEREPQQPRDAVMEKGMEDDPLQRTFKIGQLRDRLLILLGLTVACCGCILYLILWRVLPPIRSISRGAREIAAGRLDVSVPSQGKDEIAALGRAVNEIAANYQEVLLLTGTHAGTCLSAAETMEQMLKDGNGHDAADLTRQVALVKGELASIVDVVHGFRFYDAYFNGKEVVRSGPHKGNEP